MSFVKLLAAGTAMSLAFSASAFAPKSEGETASALVANASEPMPKFGAVPAWVKAQSVPPASADKKDMPFEFLLNNSQERLTADGVDNFVEYVVQPINQAGLQAIGTVAIPWNVNRADLTLNAVTIERDGKTIDALHREDVSVIRRETGLEKSMLTGIRTVVMPVRGLRVGDKLRVAFTFNTKSKLGATEEIQDLDIEFPIRRVVRRFLVDRDLPVKWAVHAAAKEVAADPPEGFAARLFVADNVEPVDKRSYVPGRFKTKVIQVSAFPSWQAVADPLIPMFAEARALPDASPVAALAEKIASEHPTAEARMLAALRAVQDDVRYVALLLGDGDYKPMSADEVWRGRFGDCKGKTVLLLALLDKLGIAGEPVLASTRYDDGLDQRLPSLALMDHVYARAKIGGQYYYLDGTDYGQRTLEELRNGTTSFIMPLVQDTALVTIPNAMPSKPLQENKLVWNAGAGVTGDVPFEATLTLRGYVAALMRAATATSTDREKLVETLKGKVPRIPNEELELVAIEEEAPDGSYIARFKGKAEIDWRPVDGMKGNRMELSQSTVQWDGEFDRDGDAEGKDAPVLLAFPYWEHLDETIILPNHGKEFRIEAEAIDKTVAGTRISRTVTMADGVVTAVSDFKRLEHEMSADEARASKDDLEAISANYAYVVAKKKLKLTEK